MMFSFWLVEKCTLVPKQKLRCPAYQIIIVIKYEILLRGASSAVGGTTETKCGTRVAWGEDDARTSNMLIAHTCAEKACDTTLGNNK